MSGLYNVIGYFHLLIDAQTLYDIILDKIKCVVLAKVVLVSCV